MPEQQPQASHAFDKLYLFPTYATREAYEKATGQPCPPWNPYRRPKDWFDPNARKSASRRIVYERALAEDPETLQSPIIVNGQPVIDALVLDREEAATVNIPPKGPNMTNIPGADQQGIPAPIRELKDSEVFVLAFGNLVQVWTIQEVLATKPQAGGGFEQADRDLLRAIALKLGVPLPG